MFQLIDLLVLRDRGYFSAMKRGNIHDQQKTKYAVVSGSVDSLHLLFLTRGSRGFVYDVSPLSPKFSLWITTFSPTLDSGRRGRNTHKMCLKEQGIATPGKSSFVTKISRGACYLPRFNLPQRFILDRFSFSNTVPFSSNHSLKATSQ